LRIINRLYSKSLDIKYIEGINLYYENTIKILFYTHENNMAITFLTFLIKEYEKSNKFLKLAQQYKILGVILSRLSDYSSSYYYLKKSLDVCISQIPINIPSVAASYLSLTYNASNQKDYEKGLQYIDLGLNYFKKAKDIEVYKISYTNLTIVKLRLLTLTQNFKSAKNILLEFENKNLQLSKLDKIYLDEVYINLKIKRYELKRNNKEELLQLINKTLKASIEIEDVELRKRILNTLKDFHVKYKNLELAYKYTNQLLKLYENQKTKKSSVLNTLNISKPPENDNDNFEIYLKDELDVAKKYQKNFYSNKIQSEKLVSKILFKPSKTLSGDYLGTFSLCNEDKYYLVVLADVVGKGITASYISFMLDGIIKSIIYNTDSFNLKNIIKDINSILADSLGGQGFVSLWAGIFDLNNNKLESVNAGHLPTFLITKNNEIVELSQGSTILGMFKTLPHFESEIISFEKGESIIAYSDGVTETMNKHGDLYEKRFNTLVESYAVNRKLEFIETLKAELNQYQDSSQIQDDVSCILLEFKN